MFPVFLARGFFQIADAVFDRVKEHQRACGKRIKRGFQVEQTPRVGTGLIGPSLPYASRQAFVKGGPDASRRRGPLDRLERSTRLLRKPLGVIVETVGGGSFRYRLAAVADGFRAFPFSPPFGTLRSQRFSES